MKKPGIIIVLAMLLSFFANGQNYKKAFKALDAKNYSYAHIQFAKAQKDIHSRSLGDYGMAIIVRSTSMRINDLYKAYKLAVNSKNYWPKCDDKLKLKYKHYFNKEKIDFEIELNDNLIFAEVQKENTIPAWNHFIKECPNSINYTQAISLRNQCAFQKAVDFNTIPTWKAFIHNYPNAEQVKEAEINLYQLAWNQCIKTISIQNLQQFIKNYPHAPQLDNAKQELLELEYKQALAINTEDAFNNFITKYPNSSQAMALQQKSIVNAYDKAKKFKTLSLCQSFLNRYPNTEYSEEIVQIRDSLAYLEAKAINTPEAYSNFINKYPNAKQVPMVMAEMGELMYSKEELMRMQAMANIRQRKLKAISAYRINPKDTSKRSLIELKRYDVFGNCVYQQNNTLPDIKEVVKYTYDNAGDKLLNKQRFINNRIQSVTSYSYNINGLEVSAKTKCNFDCIDSTGLYTDTLIYNKKRELIKHITYNSNDSIVELHNYQYNTNGYRIKEEITILSNDSLHNYNTTYNYNGNGDLIQMSKKDSQGKTVAIGSYTYDGAGHLITSTFYDAVGTIMRTYNYDSRGLLVNEIIKYEDNNGKSEVMVYRYEFL